MAEGWRNLRISTKDGSTRFIRGALRDLTEIGRYAATARTKFEVVVVQPGLSKARVTQDILGVLGATESFVERVAGGTLTDDQRIAESDNFREIRGYSCVFT